MARAPKSKPSPQAKSAARSGSPALAGPALVALAAILWATDALIRLPTVNALDPTFIVLAEHAIGVLVMLPFAFMRWRGELTALRPREWASAAFVGMGGSAFATVLFTASFRFVNPSVAILLQKLQPVIVLLLAAIFLGERPPGRFYLWGTLALAAGVVLSFPDLGFGQVAGELDVRSKGALYALGAAGLWAASTVAGKSLLGKVSAGPATFWRFAFGLIALCLLLGLSGQGVDWEVVRRPETTRSLLYMSLVPGVAAMVAYYAGLRRTKASVSTFVELIFPFAAVILNTVVLDAPLSPVQLGAGAALLLAVTAMSRG